MDFAPVAKGLYLEALAIDGDTVWLSDVIAGGVQRLRDDGGRDRWLAERTLIGGIVLNADGRMLASGLGGVAWFDPASGETGTLIAAVDGAPLPGVNEFAPDGKGGVYFGSIDLPAVLRGVKPRPSALFHLAADGTARKLDDGLAFSNGLAVTSDGMRLIHNESFVGTFAYDIRADGTLGGKQPFLEKYDCDGMAIDAEDGIWITGFASSELLRLTPDGAIDRRVAIPMGACTQIRFGGSDLRDLYITAVPGDAGAKLARGELPTEERSILYRVRSPIAGRPETAPNLALTSG